MELSAGDLLLDPARLRSVGGSSTAADRYTLYRELVIAVGAHTMIPRSTALVEVALAEPPGARIHDVGTGSGAIAVAAKHARPDLEVSGSDICPDAVRVAEANAWRLALDIDFFVADGVPAGAFDLVVANLPYLTRTHRHGLHPELEVEPDLATVVNGDDPLEVIRRVVERAPHRTRIAIQHPLDLATHVADLLDDARLVFSGRRPSVTLGLTKS